MIYLKKSQPAPMSLAMEKAKANGLYNKEDVLRQLKIDFKNKCYLCEYQQPSIQIEHFVAHKGNIDLKFDWNNLFFACGHCNNTKSDKYNDILNCTNKMHDVENRLKYIFIAFPKEEVKIESLEKSPTTENTKNLLLAVYNGTTFQKKLEAGNLKTILRQEIETFTNLLTYYQEISNTKEQQECLDKIKFHISSSSNFTAFKRWIIKNNPTLKAKFEKYFD
ncbi:MAG: HNH endonuclease [Dysgonamonadaceae bacterium]|jgi:hypothetical protein|nr:HNH endonuclease [Dysgonamonadaceae bacterium]